MNRDAISLLIAAFFMLAWAAAMAFFLVHPAVLNAIVQAVFH